MLSRRSWSSWLRGGVDHNEYDLIATQDEAPTTYKRRVNRRRYFISRTFLLRCTALLSAALVLSHFVAKSHSYPDWAPSSEQPSLLHFVVPATHADANLCKTLYSSAILGYPRPVLINWNTTFPESSHNIDPSHIAKIRGVLEFLQGLPESSNDDLVLVVDGYDVWFQLRPSVLIQRYLDINARANRRIYQQLGRAMVRESVRQTVVFSSQKKCWPDYEPYNTRCYALPESTLAQQVYGPLTDVEIDSDTERYQHFRQRYLNSGAVIGPRKQLLAIYEHAQQVVTGAGGGLDTDQGVFAVMLGEQEFQREVIRLRNRTWIDRLHDALKRLRGTYYSSVESDKADMQPASGTPFEYGIGVDYESELVLPTVFSEFDTAWLKRSDPSIIEAISSSHGIAPPRVGDLSRDINESIPPFSLDAPGLPSAETSWAEVPLFTSLYTGISPVAVHHNAFRDGLKNRRETHWNETWFQPYARALLSAQMQKPARPLAQIQLELNKDSRGDGHLEASGAHMVEARRSTASVHEWFGKIQNQGGAEVPGSATLSFMEICSGTEDEIFRDGGGPWQDPGPATEGHTDTN